MTENSKRIKKHYINPAYSVTENELVKMGRGELVRSYQLERFIWVAQLLPEYRVAIPEDLAVWEQDEEFHREHFGKGINTRVVTYIPTGRQIYDNTLPEAKAVVFEYELEHYARICKELNPHAKGDGR